MCVSLSDWSAGLTALTVKKSPFGWMSITNVPCVLSWAGHAVAKLQPLFCKVDLAKSWIPNFLASSGDMSKHETFLPSPVLNVTYALCGNTRCCESAKNHVTTDKWKSSESVSITKLFTCTSYKELSVETLVLTLLRSWPDSHRRGISRQQHVIWRSGKIYLKT